jgi:hypothetical protein
VGVTVGWKTGVVVWIELEVATALKVKRIGEIDIFHTHYIHFKLYVLRLMQILEGLYNLQSLDCWQASISEAFGEFLSILKNGAQKARCLLYIVHDHSLMCAYEAA